MNLLSGAWTKSCSMKNNRNSSRLSFLFGLAEMTDKNVCLPKNTKHKQTQIEFPL